MGCAATAAGLTAKPRAVSAAAAKNLALIILLGGSDAWRARTACQSSREGR